MKATAVLVVSILAILFPTNTTYASPWQTDCPKDRLEFREVDVGGVTLHVGCQGKLRDAKPTIVFLHGFPEYWSSWSEVASILASKFRVLLLDQRGYNLTDKPLDPSLYQLNELVSDVAGLIQATSPTRPVILVGHDFGGLIAYAAASSLPPGRVEGLVVANAPHPNVFQQLFLADLAKFPSLTGQFAASQYILTFFPSAMCPLTGLCPYAIPEAYYSNPDNGLDDDDTDDVDYANLVQLVTSWGEGIRVDQKLFSAWNQTPGLTPDTHLTSMFNWYRAIVPLLFAPPLPPFDVNVPTLILWGSRDPILVEANVDRKVHPDYPAVQTLDDFISDLRVEKFSDAGHFIQHEKAIEVAAEIKKFVDRLPGGVEPEP